MSKYHKDDRGTLIPIEFDKLTFEPKRVFVADVNTNNIRRGGHAHYTTEQFAICIEGEIDMLFFEYSEEPAKVITMKKGDSVFIPKLVWDEQIYKTKDSKLLVICSTEYNKNDYIDSLTEFFNIKGERNEK
tara:strand:- start:111 stop:503 length:393 start_codon:yes stop_codon:yes gene_type:complete